MFLCYLRDPENTLLVVTLWSISLTPRALNFNAVSIKFSIAYK
jgi:hypothetical protein